MSATLTFRSPTSGSAHCYESLDCFWCFYTAHLRSKATLKRIVPFPRTLFVKCSVWRRVLFVAQRFLRIHLKKHVKDLPLSKDSWLSYIEECASVLRMVGCVRFVSKQYASLRLSSSNCNTPSRWGRELLLISYALLRISPATIYIASPPSSMEADILPSGSCCTRVAWPSLSFSTANNSRSKNLPGARKS